MTSPAALHGVRVIDLTRLLPGGFATMTLADLGADVIKVEQPGVGDGARHAPPYAAGEGALHLLLGRGKRSMCIDLSTDDGRTTFLDLVRTADVVVDSFRPGVLDRLGLGHPVMSEANRRLVQISLTGYGPDDGRAGHDIDYVAEAGLLSLGPPVAPATQTADLAGAMWTVVAVLSALRERDRTGEGQVCDVSLTGSALTTAAIATSALAVDGLVPEPGRQWFNGGLAAYDVYACADRRHVAVGALEPKFFAALCNALDVPDLVALHLDPSGQERVRARLAERFATRSRDEWMSVLGDTDACVAPVLDLAEAMAGSPFVRERPLPDGSSLPQVGLPFERAGGGAEEDRAAPRLGEHCDAVLGSLGYDDARIAALRDAGVV